MMRVGLRSNPVPVYQMHDKSSPVDLEWKEEEKDLGVLVDKKLTFQQEINARVKKANILTGIIRRTFTFLDERNFARLFKSLVRPHLEYAAAVWSPHWKKDIKKQEAVQRTATKLVLVSGI